MLTKSLTDKNKAPVATWDVKETLSPRGTGMF